MRKTSTRFRETKTPQRYSDYLLENGNTKNTYEFDPVLNAYVPKVEFDWPQGLHDPMMLKLAHAYFWILNEGRLLSDMSGRIVIFADEDPNSKESEFLTRRAHPSVNVGDGQFIVTLYRGFDEPPYDTTLFMGFHFHTDDKSKLGYNAGIGFLFDQYEDIKGPSDEGEISFSDVLEESKKIQTYDMKTPVHSLYPY
jgi:hypothetical protein